MTIMCIMNVIMLSVFDKRMHCVIVIVITSSSSPTLSCLCSAGWSPPPSPSSSHDLQQQDQDDEHDDEHGDRGFRYFLWGSERSGFMQLYLYRFVTGSSSSAAAEVVQSVQCLCEGRAIGQSPYHHDGAGGDARWVIDRCASSSSS